VRAREAAILVGMATSASPPVRPPRSWRRRIGFACLRLTLYWTAYTLSIGPMFWMWYESQYLDGPRWIAVFYFPLLWACDAIEPFGDLVNWYINLWIL
jgi:hypothetical protein